MIAYKGSFNYESLLGLTYSELMKWNDTAIKIYKDQQGS